MFGTAEIGKHKGQEDNGEHNTTQCGSYEGEGHRYRLDCHATEFSVKCAPFLHRSSCDTAAMNQNIVI